MQCAIETEANYQGVTQEERMLLRQFFDKIQNETLNSPDIPQALSSNQGENDDALH